MNISSLNKSMEFVSSLKPDFVGGAALSEDFGRRVVHNREGDKKQRAQVENVGLKFQQLIWTRTHESHVLFHRCVYIYIYTKYIYIYIYTVLYTVYDMMIMYS